MKNNTYTSDCDFFGKWETEVEQINPYYHQEYKNCDPYKGISIENKKYEIKTENSGKYIIDELPEEYLEFKCEESYPFNSVEHSQYIIPQNNYYHQEEDLSDSDSNTRPYGAVERSQGRSPLESPLGTRSDTGCQDDDNVFFCEL
jgi:hypothetical protein